MALNKKGSFTFVTEAFQSLISKLWPFALFALGYLIYNSITWGPASELVAVLATTILIVTACSAPTSLIGKFLELTPVVFIGKISYGLYLWHYPIMIVMFFHHVSEVKSMIIGIPLSFLAAFLSYYFVEQPALCLRSLHTLPAQKLGLAAATFSILGIIAGSGYFFRDYVHDYLSTTPMTIESYDPHKLKVGEGFNVQPSGQSCLWMRFSRVVPKGAKLRIGNFVLTPDIHGRLITAILPPELLNSPGKSDIVLVDENTKPLTLSAASFEETTQ